MTKLTIPAVLLKPGDVLLDDKGEPALRWSSGEPHKIDRVELVAQVTFDDYRVAEWEADHELDVERP